KFGPGRIGGGPLLDRTILTAPVFPRCSRVYDNGLPVATRRRTMRRALLLSAAFVAFAFGCSSASVEDDAAGSEAAHTEGEYVHFANHPFVWTKDVAHSEMTFAEEDLSKVVPDSDPLAKRLQ